MATYISKDNLATFLSQCDIRFGAKVNSITSTVSTATLSRGANKLSIQPASTTYTVTLNGYKAGIVNQWMVQFTPTSNSKFNTVKNGSTTVTVKWINGSVPTFEKSKLYEVIFTTIDGTTFTASWVKYNA